MSGSRTGTVAGGAAALIALAAAAGPPAALRFTNAPVQVQAGQCSAPLTVELADDAGATAVAAAFAPVSLSGGVTFFQSSCFGTAVTQVGIDAGTSATSFVTRAMVAGRYPVTASSPGLADASQEVEVLPDLPRKATFTTGPFTLDAGACSPQVAFRLEDAYGNLSPTAGPLTLGISGSPTTTMKAYSDPGCVTELPQLDLPASASGGAFYFKDPAAGTLNLLVSGGSVIGTQVEHQRPTSMLLQLELAGESTASGSELEVRATVRYPGAGAAERVQLHVEVDGVFREQPIDPNREFTVSGGSFLQFTERAIVIASPGEEIVARGQAVLAPDGAPIGLPAESRRAVDPMLTDVGGCTCASAGGADLAVALAALALLRGSRRRSPCSS